MVSQAMASDTSAESDLPGAVTRSAETGRGLVSELGTERTAGTWLDADGRPVVAVTDEEAAADVRKAGAQAKMVNHSMSELRSATATLKDSPRVSGTSWSMDYANNQVVVRADRTVSADEWSRLTKVAESIGKSVRMERIDGEFTPRLNGGEPMLMRRGPLLGGLQRDQRPEQLHSDGGALWAGGHHVVLGHAGHPAGRDDRGRGVPRQ